MPTASSPILELKTPKQIRALTAVARQDIVDVLEAEGPCTIRDLAERLDKPPDALYYHVKLLIKAGLLHKSTTDDGHLQVGLVGRPRITYEPENPKNRDSVIAVVRAILRSSERRFARAFLPGRAVVSGPRRTLWAGRARGRLSPEQIEAVNEHIIAVLKIMNTGADADANTQEFSFVFAPLDSTSE